MKAADPYFRSSLSGLTEQVISLDEYFLLIFSMKVSLFFTASTIDSHNLKFPSAELLHILNPLSVDKHNLIQSFQQLSAFQTKVHNMPAKISIGKDMLLYLSLSIPISLLLSLAFIYLFFIFGDLSFFIQ